MSKRECPDCGTTMEPWYIQGGYEEWFCNSCKTYYEYEDDEVIKKLDLEGSG